MRGNWIKENEYLWTGVVSRESEYEKNAAYDQEGTAEWDTAENPRWKSYTVDAGCFLDITKVKIVWLEGAAGEYAVEVSTDDFSWYTVENLSKKDDGNNVYMCDVSEAYRRYIRVKRKCDQGSEPLVKTVEILAAQSLLLPEVPVGPEVMGIPRPVLLPLPIAVEGIANPVISLGGLWKFTQYPPDAFWENGVTAEGWSDVVVPGQLEVQGFHVRNDEKCINDWHATCNYECAYKTRIGIPKDFEGKAIILRFEAAYSYARIWVNGRLVRIHRGGFTSFDCDITEFVTPGTDAWLTVGLTSEVNSIHFVISRGITGDVKLIAVPRNHICRLHAETDFDDDYCNAVLKVSAGMMLRDPVDSELKIRLKAPDGNEVNIPLVQMHFNGKIREQEIDILVPSPQAWDAEHPRLYTLEAQLVQGGVVVQKVLRKVGFRKITIHGNRMYINGRQIKLRGINWWNSHPTLGITADYDKDREALSKLKKANINYIRTSHWSQYEYVLDLADEMGFYVEQEASVMMLTIWVKQNRERFWMKNQPGASAHFLGQMAEIIEKDRSHPSIVIYSMANETHWGTNFERCYEYIKAVDSTRPVKFSWGHQAKPGYVDIFSLHYPEKHEFEDEPLPKVYDEYSHLYCNDLSRHEKDPSLRDYYVNMIRKEWETVYRQPGGLGGAIWHARDFYYFSPDGIWTGFRTNWGILDTWCREKPEYWHVKKTYSPVKIDEAKVYSVPPKGEYPVFDVENRFCHTNLNELTVVWTTGGRSGRMKGPDIAPMSVGSMILPVEGVKEGDQVYLRFLQTDSDCTDEVVDEYCFVMGGEKAPAFYPPQGPAPCLVDGRDCIKVCGDRFEIAFRKINGMIQYGMYDGIPLMAGGPHLNLGIDTLLTGWCIEELQTEQDEAEATVVIRGSYNEVKNVQFRIKIDGTGLLSISFAFDTPEFTVDEIGVVTDLVETVQSIHWKRRGDWTVYPEYHIGRVEGTAQRNRGSGSEVYGEKPEWPWSLDEKEFLLFDRMKQTGWRGTRDFRAGRHDIFYYTAMTSTGVALRIESDGTGSARAFVNTDGTVGVAANAEWGHRGLNEFKQMFKYLNKKEDSYSGEVHLRMAREDMELQGKKAERLK